MLRTMMKSKIHRATVTQADLHYVGSVTVDEDLLDAADLLPGVVPPGTEAWILIAARVGTTRLIDNMPLVLGEPVASREGES